MVSQPLPIATTRPPLQVKIAAVFIVLCAIALVAFAIALALASFLVKHNPVYATRTQAIGFAYLVGFVVLGAALLIVGIRQLYKERRRTMLLTILGIPLILGSIGQTVDMFGTASKTSDLIGFGILLLFAFPIVLLLHPATKAWCSRS